MPGHNIVVSIFGMDPTEVPDMKRFTNDRLPVYQYHDGYALRLLYSFPTETGAEVAVNNFLGGSPATTAAMVPDFRNITLLRWMNQYPGVVLIFTDGTRNVIPVPDHQKACGLEKSHTFNLDEAIATATAKGFNVMILQHEALPDPNPFKCSACGVETDDPAGRCWLTVGHPTTEGPLPYPICDACQNCTEIVADFVNDNIGTVVLAPTLPSTIGYVVRCVVGKQLLYWNGKEEPTPTNLCTKGFGEMAIFPTPRAAKDEMLKHWGTMTKMGATVVPITGLEG